MPLSDIPTLVRAIRDLHGCEATHVESVPVCEVFRGQVAWNGVVEVFNIAGHPKAKRAFAWNFEKSGKRMSTAVLEIPPVDSPQSAVKMAIVAEAKKR